LFINDTQLNEELFGSKSLPYVFHFTPKSVMMTAPYKAWMAKFGVDTIHVLLNDHSAGFSSQDVLIYTKKLHMVAPGLFPPLWKLCQTDFAGEDLSETFAGLGVVSAQSAMRFQLRPHMGPDPSEMKAFDEEAVAKEVLAMEGVSELIEKAHADMKKVDESAPAFPRITFLGTGSSVPNKYRCVSAILVEVEEDLFILMDCGEGSSISLKIA
jgi:ribonuclease Z